MKKKNNVFLYIGCSVVSLFLVICICVMTYNILGHINSRNFVSNVYNPTEIIIQQPIETTVEVTGVTTEVIIEKIEETTVVETTEETNNTECSTEPVDIKNGNDELKSDLLNELHNSFEDNETVVKTPEVETKLNDLYNYIIYEDDCRIYVVQDGDNLSYVSTLVGCSVEMLVELNGIENADLIYTSTKLKLPNIK